MTLTLTAQAPHRTKQAMVYQALRGAILRCELHPGQRLIIDEIAGQLGVSHIPVREALQLLQSEGLVDNVPHAGATVAPISRDAIVEVFTLMEGLEFVAMRIAAERLTPADLAALAALVHEMDDALAAGDGARWPELNSEFHRAIARGTGMTLLQEMTDRALDRWDRVRRYFFNTVLSHRMDRAQDEHHAILAALQARDPARLEELAKVHNRGALAAYMAQMP